MNIETLNRLKKNPFYKLSPKQKKELEEYERESQPVVHFGIPSKHQVKVQKVSQRK